VGGEESIRVDVRVVAATNRDLRDQVAIGEFRRDLYHRLNVLRIDLPPLRERRADIPRLIDRFIREFSAQHERPFVGIDPEALRVLVEYEWPGNVRELRNLVESMVVLAPGRVIRPEDIPPEVRHKRTGSLLPVLAPRPVSQGAPGRGEDRGPSPELEFVLRTLYDLRMNLEDLRRDVEEIRKRDQPPMALPAATGYAPYGQPIIPLGAPIQPPEPEPEEEQGVVVFRRGMTLADMEREAITVALREARGNRRRAAEMLGMGERTLYRKLKEYDLEPEP
jgi:DNA-binding NtrC family response regulator